MPGSGGSGSRAGGGLGGSNTEHGTTHIYIYIRMPLLHCARHPLSLPLCHYISSDLKDLYAPALQLCHHSVADGRQYVACSLLTAAFAECPTR